MMRCRPASATWAQAGCVAECTVKLPLVGKAPVARRLECLGGGAVASSVPAPPAEGRGSSRGHLAAGWLDALYAEGPYARKKRVKYLVHWSCSCSLGL